MNLGCGRDIRPDYTNVDIREHPGVDLVADLSQLPWPFATDSCEEIMMLDFLEHFPYAKTLPILMECFRVLRQGGRLVVQVPDAEILGAVLSRRGTFQCNRCGEWMRGTDGDEYDRACPGCGQPYEEVLEAAVRRMFGGQDYMGNFHHVCFTFSSLIEKAAACGLRFDEIEDDAEDEHQAANWSLKCRFEKGDLWG